MKGKFIEYLDYSDNGLGCYVDHLPACCIYIPIYESPEAVNTGNSNLKLKKLLMKCTVTQCVNECTYMYCCEE